MTESWELSPFTTAQSGDHVVWNNRACNGHFLAHTCVQSVDLPTLGRPTKATKPSKWSGLQMRGNHLQKLNWRSYVLQLTNENYFLQEENQSPIRAYSNVVYEAAACLATSHRMKLWKAIGHTTVSIAVKARLKTAPIRNDKCPAYGI